MTTRGSFLAGLGLFAGATVLMIAGGVWAAEPQPWQFGLQPPAGSIAEKATSLHNLACDYHGNFFICAGFACVYLCAVPSVS